MAQQSSAPRVVVLGRQIDHPDVISSQWDAIKALPSLDNFGVVVLDMTTIGNGQQGALAERASEMRRFLFAPEDKTIEVLSVGWHGFLARVLDVRPKVINLDGYEYDLSDPQPDLEAWFSRVDRYDHAFDSPFSAQQGHKAADIQLLATNPTGLAIAISYRDQHQSTSIPITILPPHADHETTSDALLTLIVQRYGLGAVEAPPEWLDAVERLPNHESASIQVSELVSQIADLSRDLGTAETLEQHERRYQPLLYEQGDSLETLVREALRELGCNVNDPLVKGREDGRVGAPTGHWAALEVKGRNGQIGRKDARQLDDWVDGVKEDDPSREWTGLMVTNAHRLLPPGERSESLAPGALEYLNAFGYKTVSTIEIYYALAANQRGDFDEIAWWSTIFGP